MSEPIRADTVSRRLESELLGRLVAAIPGAASISARRPNPHTSRLDAHILTLDGQAERPLVLVKLGGARTRNVAGSPWGVSYEAMVYRQLLVESDIRTPRFLASLELEGHAALAVEYLPDAVKVSKTRGTAAIERAAEAIGRFHRKREPATQLEPGFPNIYDLRYFRRWIELVAKQCVPGSHYPEWLPDGLKVADGLFQSLDNGTRTVVHGEFYPSNILASDRGISVVDWEWAGLGAGELDLAALIEGWPVSDVGSVVRSYCAARWAGKSSDDVAGLPRRLRAAQAYFALRWLGGRAGRVQSEDAEEHLERLRVAVQPPNRRLLPGGG